MIHGHSPSPKRNIHTKWAHEYFSLPMCGIDSEFQGVEKSMSPVAQMRDSKSEIYYVGAHECASVARARGWRSEEHGITARCHRDNIMFKLWRRLFVNMANANLF